MSEQSQEDALYELMKSAWNGQDNWMIFNGTHYQVFTPNGPDEPIFVPKTEESLYGALSHRTAEPKPITGRKAQPKQRFTRNPKHTDVEE